MILSSRPHEAGAEPQVLIEADESADPPVMSVYVNGRLVSMKRVADGFSLFDIATIFHELDIGFDYQELK